ncbi:MAG TPA: fused MFS/spermidine synthase [Polyangiaceae bacterium]|nr:fused MFS/spermidine synthase [Polyangiaceae bacterium]
MDDAGRELSSGAALPRWLLYAISFWGGFQIMVLEICGFRVLQTNLGSSVIVTGTLLTLIMVLLSAGYYAGGVLSKRWHSGSRGLFSLLLGAALYSALANGPLLEPIAAFGLSLREGLGGHTYLQSIVPSALLCLVLYGPPVLVMSMISPYLIRLRTNASGARPAGEPRAAGEAPRAGDAGIESGFFMSLSTVGSIAGTMLASYLTVPFFGVHVTALVTSAGFFALVAVAWLLSGPLEPRARLLKSTSALVVLLGALLSLGFRSPARDENVIYQADSHYGELQVVKRTDDAGRTMLTYHPSRVYMHSLLFPDEPLRDMEGNIYFVPGLLRPPRSALVLGSAAGGALRGLALAFPGARITGVDLDPKVHEVATQVFGVDPQKTELVTADARVFLNETNETYDLIIVDLFAGEFIPSHCVSVEFFELVRKRLSPNGSVFVNTNMNDIPFELGEDEPFRAVRHLQSTLRAAGFHDLIENHFFHSIFAFTSDMPIETFRAGLARERDNAERPAPLRAAAGLALYSSFAVPADRERYRPFTDSWTPAFLIELKTNVNGIYEAVEAQGEPRVLAASDAAVPAPLLQRWLARHEAEWRESHDKGFSQLDPLLTALDGVDVPIGPATLDLAARYLQFSFDPADATVQPHGDWAKLASLYGRLHDRGHANDYETVIAVLAEIRRELDRS